MNTVSAPTESNALLPASPAGAPIPADRINELYRGEIFPDETAQIARDRIHWMCSQVDGDRVLDVGCSQGITAILLAREGCSVTAIDTHPESMAFAREEVSRETPLVQSRLRLIETDLASLPEEPSFDTIVMGEVLEHQALPERFLRAALQRLRTGGRLVITTPFALHPHPDHKISVFPSHIGSLAKRLGLTVRFLDVVDHYIRAVLTSGSDAPGADAQDMLDLTERATLASQRRLFDRLDERREQLKKKSDALKIAQRKLTDASGTAEAQAKARAAELESQRHRHEEALTALRSELAAAQRLLAEANNRHEEALAAQRNELQRALAEAQARSEATALERVQQLTSALAAARNEARSERRRFEQEIIQLKERNERLKQRLAALKESLLVLKSGTSYRLGREIVLGVKSPRSLLSLPGALFSLGRDVLARRKARAGALENGSASAAVARLPSQTAAQSGPSSSRTRSKPAAAGKSGDKLKDHERMQRLELLKLADCEAVVPIAPIPRRVCYVLHNALPFSSGGYATRAQGIAQGLQQAGYEIISITRPGYPFDMKPDLTAGHVEAKETIGGVPYVRIPAPLKKGAKCPRGVATDDYLVAAADELERRFRQLRPEVVVAASNHLTGLPSLIAARRLGIPFVYEVRGFWEITRLSREPEFAHTVVYEVECLMEAGVAQRADHVFTLTGAMADELLKRGVDAQRLSLLPNSCDVSQFEPAGRDRSLAKQLGIEDDVPVIGYVGTFVDYEGLDDLARACGRLKALGVEFRLLLVGNEDVSSESIGPITRAVHEIADAGGYRDWLIMPGRVPHEQVKSYYSLIDIAPFPRTPSLVCEMVSPMKPLEAMAMEKAVLVSSVEALREMVDDGITGMVFTKGSIGSLTEKLRLLITDAALRRALGRAAREHVIATRTWRHTGEKARIDLERVVKQTATASAGDLEAELGRYRELLRKAADQSSSLRTHETGQQIKSVYFLHSSLPHLTGGYATRTHGLVKGMLAAGVSIVPVTRPGFPWDLKEESLKRDFPLLDDIEAVGYRRIHGDIDRVRLSEADYMAATIDAFTEVLAEEQPAIVHGRSTYLISLPALIAARRAGLPFVYEVSGLWELVHESRNADGKKDQLIARIRGLEDFVIREADALVTLNEDMRQELIGRGADANRISLVPNSVDADRFTPTQRSLELLDRLGIDASVPVVGYVGTFVDYEGLDDLVTACHSLVSRGVRLKLLLVGDGPARIELKRQIAKLKMQDTVVLTGRVPHEEVRSYYSVMDILVYPRKAWDVCETVSPMKPLEALALQKAVVVSGVKPLRSIVQHGVTGMVFEKGNLRSLTDSIGELLSSEHTRNRIGAQAREWVASSFSWTQAGATMARVYAEVLAQRRAKTPDVSSPVAPHTSPGVEESPASAAASASASHSSEPCRSDLPPWWNSIPAAFRKKCSYVDVSQLELSRATVELRELYISRFGPEPVAKRIPLSNWQRADLCMRTVPADLPLLDIGSGLGEFVNLFASVNAKTPLSSVDVKDYSLWFDATGRVKRIYESIFDLDPAHCASDLVTCFEVIEHLPPDRLAEGVGVLRKLAKRKLYVSVPFMEPLPLYKGHFTRFDATNLEALFPDARFTIFGKGGGSKSRVSAWVMCEVNVEA